MQHDCNCPSFCVHFISKAKTIAANHNFVDIIAKNVLVFLSVEPTTRDDVFTRVKVQNGYHWSVTYKGVDIPKTSPVIAPFPDALSILHFAMLLDALDNVVPCCKNGNFVELVETYKKSGQSKLFCAHKHTVIGHIVGSTIASVNCCEIVSNAAKSYRCHACMELCAKLRAGKSYYKTKVVADRTHD